MKAFAASLGLALLPALALAQTQPSVTEIATQTIETSIRDDASAALLALESGDHYKVASLLRSAATNATRLSARSVTEKISAAAPSFNTENSRFALAQSSTLEFENLINSGNAYERRFKDLDGRVVTVRVFGENEDLQDFMFIANDSAMLEKGKIEVAEMRGEQALKSRKEDGSLSVLMMSEEDHALIEIEGADEDAVMAFIGELEAAE